MLAGEPPFAGTGARATMARHAIERPTAIRALRPTAPMAVERALERALAKAPGERFPAMTEFMEALTEPGFELAGTAPAGDARAIAVLPFVNASADPENEYFSDGMTEELITALTKVEGLHVASRTSVFALKGVREDVRTLGARLGRQRRARGIGATGRQPAPDYRPAHQRARRADALVGALRP